MPLKHILFEAGPMMDVKKTGVGYYTEHLMRSLGERSDSSVSYIGYYFDFLNRNNKQPPSAKGLSFNKIRYTPGKVLSLCRRLGFQPPIELFQPQKADTVLYTNYVALPHIRKHKTILVVYDLSFLDHPEYLQEINLRYLQKFCPPSIKNADCIITISDFTKQRLLHHFPKLTAEIVITPIPPASPATSIDLDDQLQNLGIAKGKYILYLGTVEPRKNIQNLVAAYVGLPTAIKDTYALVIAGGRGWKDEAILADIQKAQAQGNRIIQPGYISDDQKTALYSNSACFVLPSHYEGFGMPILEAMQYDIPVAVSDIPVFHEVAGEAAAYFNKDDPSDMAATLQDVLTNSTTRERLISSGRTQLSTFSWDRNAELVTQALQKIGS